MPKVSRFAGWFLLVIFAVFVVVTFYINLGNHLFIQDSSKKIIPTDTKLVNEFLNEVAGGRRPKIVWITYTNKENIESGTLDIFSPSGASKPPIPMIGCNKPQLLLGNLIAKVEVTGNLMLLSKEMGDEAEKAVNSIFLQCLGYGFYDTNNFSLFRDGILPRYINTQLFTINNL